MDDAESWSERDRDWMQLALKLAGHGLYACDPNPRVGCVLVRDDRLVGQGWHQRAGGPHAEREALDRAGDAARGATCYVTLEPCAHQGRTGPCSEALIQAGVSRVIAATRDPNPRVAGGGLDALRAAGITVSTGLLEEQSRALNPGFFARMSEGRPWVRVKLAASVDGRTALANGQSQWITGAEARADGHHWRARASAIVIGSGTLLADDPRLDARPEPMESERELQQPVRVVLDSRYRTPADARIFAADAPVWIIGDRAHRPPAALGDRAETLGVAGAGVAGAGDGEGLDLAAVFSLLAEREMNEVHVEAGAVLAGALLDAGLVDELLVYLAPMVLGDRGRGMFGLAELTDLQRCPRFAFDAVDRLGQDLRVILHPERTTGVAGTTRDGRTSEGGES